MSQGWTSRISTGGIGIAFLAGLLIASLFHVPLTSSAQQSAPSYTAGKTGAPAPAPGGTSALTDLSQAFAAVAEQVPSITMERAIASRRGRLYLDCLQNGYGKTIVAPYSPRGIDGAPVSAPLRWEEVTKKLDPKRFNIRTMPRRLAKVGDLFAPLLRSGAKLPSLAR